MTGRVFAIEEFSVHDGPGMRMTIFLKGCPLRCNWCHNPEGQRFEVEISKRVQGCVKCGQCLDAAQLTCGKRRLMECSIDVCPNHLLRKCGTDYTAQQLADIILKKGDFIKDGGVTFSGGEPLAQSDFLLASLSLLKGRTHRALQTSGYAEADLFSQVLHNVEYVLYDLKLMNEQKSIKYIGKSNKKILKNFEILAASAVPYVVRVPLIPTVTDTEGNLASIADFMVKCGANNVELMPYHKLAGSKYAMIGAVYAPKFDEHLAVTPHIEIFESRGIKVKILS